VGLEAELVRTAAQVNQYQDEYLTKVVLCEVAQAGNSTVGVFGLAL
jgi:UDP-N-acetyl-D-mannosaminuronate dehydrogenase